MPCFAVAAACGGEKSVLNSKYCFRIENLETVLFLKEKVPKRISTAFCARLHFLELHTVTALYS
jgi:hypothetical protein